MAMFSAFLNCFFPSSSSQVSNDARESNSSGKEPSSKDSEKRKSQSSSSGAPIVVVQCVKPTSYTCSISPHLYCSRARLENSPHVRGRVESESHIKKRRNLDLLINNLAIPHTINWYR
ncbi:hypothetical protein DVH24_016187 [Malus domestica]|uniref:Uncharacterized protein n=1 Tax=Malus domestica TaxID=3750 RepID=A0A498JF16_MALDO|nr:hypothetical protein DVH24_016187 [Malus domestica]